MIIKLGTGSNIKVFNNFKVIFKYVDKTPPYNEV